MAGAPALIVFVWLNASCLTNAAASVEEGTKWKGSPWSSCPGAYCSRTWEKVTSVLEEAKKNATFPGMAGFVGLCWLWCIMLAFIYAPVCASMMQRYKGRGSFLAKRVYDP